MMKVGGVAERPVGRCFSPIWCHVVLLVLSLAGAALASAAVPVAGKASPFPDQAVILSIQAANVPLRDLLRNISERVGVTLVLYPRAEEPVTVTKSNENLESVLKDLLKDYNFALHYRDRAAGLLNKIFVLSRKTPAREVQTGLIPDLLVTVNQPGPGPTPGGPALAASPGHAVRSAPAGGHDASEKNLRKNTGAPAPDPAQDLVQLGNTPTESGGSRFVAMTRATAASFGGVFLAAKDQIEAAALALDDCHGFFRKDGAQKHGLRLKAMTSESPLAALGLVEGDVVREINGQAVRSAAELARYLDKAIGKEGGAAFIIGLERPIRSGAGQEVRTAMTPQHINVQFVK